MKISPSQLRSAVTDAAYRLPVGKEGGGPSTDGALRSAIRVVHSMGAEYACPRSLHESLASDYWKGRGKSLARTAEICLLNYIALAERDAKTWAPGRTLSLSVGEDVITANVDGVLVSDAGYRGRLVVPGPLAKPLTTEQRILLCCPSVLALAQEMEGGFWDRPVLGAELWELRSGATGAVSTSRG